MEGAAVSTICGRYVRTFPEADTAMLDRVSMNAPYRFFWLKIVAIEGRELVCDAYGEPYRLPIRRTARGQQSLIVMADPVFGSVKYPVLPFLSEGGTGVGALRQLALAL